LKIIEKTTEEKKWDKQKNKVKTFSQTCVVYIMVALCGQLFTSLS